MSRVRTRLTGNATADSEKNHQPPIISSRARKFRPTLSLPCSVIALGTALAFPTGANGQCVLQPDPLLVTTGTCTDTGGSRSSSSGPAISVSGDGVYLGNGVGISTSGTGSVGVLSSAGGTVTADNLVIATQGPSSSGVVADGIGSSATLTNTSVSTLGDSSVGLYAKGGAAIVGSDLAIRVEGTDGEAHGVLAEAGGSIDLTRASITTTGLRSEGLYAVGASRITGTDLVIVTEGDLADGTNAFDGGEVHLTGGSIRVMGTGAAGLYAYLGSQMSATNVQIDIRGDDSNAAIAVNNSTVTLTGGLVTTAGESGTALWAYDNSTIVADNVRIATSGSQADGVKASLAGSTATLTGGTVTTLGSNANGVSALNGGSLTATGTLIATVGAGSSGALSSAGAVDLRNASLTTTGALAHGLSAQAGGTLAAVTTTVEVSGVNAAAIQIAGGSALAPNLVTVTGGRLASSQGPLILSEGAVGTISLTGPMATSAGTVGGQPVLAMINAGSGGATPSDLTLTMTRLGDIADAIRVANTGNVVNASFDATNWTGDLIADAGNTPNIALRASRWTGQASEAANIDLDGTSVWNVTGTSNVMGTLANAGLVQFVPLASGFSTLTTGSYIGQGGRMVFNTYLGTDNSPTNLLVLNGGAATGVTALAVTNAGGGGELTLGDGIRLVQTVNGGSTAPGAFTLAGRTAAGAYEYLLFRGGSSGAEDWFLRSTLISAPVDPVAPPTPTPPVPDPDIPVIPLYRPEVALYTPIPAMARHMGLATLGTLHERVGEEINIQNRPDSGRFGNGVWGRLIGESSDSRWAGTVDARVEDARLGGIQLGFDLYRTQHDNGHRDHIGLYGAKVDYRSSAVGGFALGQQHAQLGQLTLNGPVVGAYWTHFGASGWYLDAVIQQSWFDAKATSRFDTQMSTSGKGFTASLEGGYPVELSQRWLIEPQAQIIYQRLSVDSSEDAYSTVDWAENGAMTARVGARLQYTARDGETLWQPYLKANVWHGFRGTDLLSFGTSPAIESRFGTSAVELGAGLTARLSRTVSLYGHVDHRWAVAGGERRTATQGAVGVRFNW